MTLVASFLAFLRTHEAEPVRGTLAGCLSRDSVVIGVHADLYNAFHDADLMRKVSVGSRASGEAIVMIGVPSSDSRSEMKVRRAQSLFVWVVVVTEPRTKAATPRLLPDSLAHGHNFGYLFPAQTSKSMEVRVRRNTSDWTLVSAGQARGQLTIIVVK